MFFCCFVVLVFLFLLYRVADAAIPFVTDDSFIQNKGQLAIETFSELWFIPQKNEANGATLIGQYLSGSYGVNEYLEITAGGLAGYDFQSRTPSYMNIILQAKTPIVDSKQYRYIPGIALSFGYVTKSGKGQYYDPATNLYIISAMTKHLFEETLIAHVNIGMKASYEIPIPSGNIIRPHIGIGLDFAPFGSKLRLILESFNGAPNSPRDSSGYFKSVQFGIRMVSSEVLSFHVLYGTQPTFVGYTGNEYASVYRQTQWLQIGTRMVLN